MATILKIHSPSSGKQITRQTRGYHSWSGSRIDGVEIINESLGAIQVKPTATENHHIDDANDVEHHVYYKFPPGARDPHAFLSQYAFEEYKNAPDTTYQKVKPMVTVWALANGRDADYELGTQDVSRHYLPHDMPDGLKEIIREFHSELNHEFDEIYERVKAKYLEVKAAASADGILAARLPIYGMFKLAMDSASTEEPLALENANIFIEVPEDADEWDSFETLLA